MEIFLLHVLKWEQRNSIVHLLYNIHILSFCPLLFITLLSKIRYTMSLSVSSYLNSEPSLHFSVYWLLYGKWYLFQSGDDDCIAHLYLNNWELCLFASIEVGIQRRPISLFMATISRITFYHFSIQVLSSLSQRLLLIFPILIAGPRNMLCIISQAVIFWVVMISIHSIKEHWWQNKVKKKA